jgi:hypothetical protein
MAGDPADPNPYAAPRTEVAATGQPAGRNAAGLRITAGVFLLIAAVINLFAAVSYFGGGVLGSGRIDLRKVMEAEARKTGKPLTEEQEEKMAKVDEAMQGMRASATSFVVFGGYLLLTVALSIAAAVFLFKGKHGGFVLLTALLVGAAEVIGPLLTRFGFLNVFGLGIAILVAVSAVSMLRREA